MSLQNLREDFLYSLLPEGIISLDEQGLIQSVVGGYQDRVDDLRAYTSKLELLVTAQGLPETDVFGNPTNNAVVVQVQSPQGKVYNRSLEIHDDTPPPGDPALFAWGTNQLQLDEDHVALSAAYGIDLFRLVDASILNYLASTVGAVLYHTAAQDPNNADTDSRRLLSTWFPRLQFKGTAESFETLGKLLGFDDVRMTPLWGRLSPRIANDIGDPDNDQDFATLPEFLPKQVRDNFYDPWVLNDGPFFTFTGTVSARFGTNSTSFYTQIVNGFNPFVSVSIVGTAPTDPVSAQSPYILVGGGPETKARIDTGSGLLFEAISAGSSFNGLQINFQDISNGTYRVMSIEDRLSAIKYRTSFYDLALTMDFDHAIAQFGTNVVQANSDLKRTPTIANFGATAVSPFRPWTAGLIATQLTNTDWLESITPNGNVSVIVPRTQADLTARQLDQESVMAAAAQVVQALEEVRPATRRARHINAGYLIRDQVGYAEFCAMGTVFTTGSNITGYSGVLKGFPTPPYNVLFSIGTNVLTHETNPHDPHSINISGTDHNVEVFGTYDYDSSVYGFTFPVNYPSGTIVYADYTPTSTEIVRVPQDEIFLVDTNGNLIVDPIDGGRIVDPSSGTVACLADGFQARPEDQLDPVSMDMPEEYPWRRDLVGGGELIDFDTYSPPALRSPQPQPDIATVPLGQTVSVFSQTGAQYDVNLVTLGAQPPHFEVQARDLDHYVPGQMAIAFSGTFRDLSIPVVQTGSISLSGGLDNVLQAGWQMYHFGLVQGVLVADAPKFFGEHHRTGLGLWFPFNEHPREALAVVDHSVYATNPSVGGLAPSDRSFDPVQGWYLAADVGLSLSTPIDRGMNPTFAGGFWFRPSNVAGPEQFIVKQGPLVFSSRNLDGINIDFNWNIANAQVASLGGGNGWTFISWSFDGSVLRVDTWDSNGVWNETQSPPLLNVFTTDTTCSVMCPQITFDIRDLRMWSVTKTAAQLKLASNHQPTPTACLYRPAYLVAANDYDHYGMRVLPSGLIVPELLPTSVITNKLAWVQRYDSLGRYFAQDRFKETGLGSANQLPQTQQLGLQWDSLTAAGTACVSTFSGVNTTGRNPQEYLSVSHGGTVYAASQPGTLVTPPLFIYGNEETAVSVSGTSATNLWVGPNTFGLSQTPPVAALTTNGQIAFQIGQTVQPGFYRLRVTSGNIGKVDDAFSGFRTVITVGDVAFQALLCAGKTGANFSSTDTFEFTVPNVLPGAPSSWLLTFDWTNALRDFRRGTARQLEILGFELTRYNTTLYSITLGTNFGTNAVFLTPLGVTSADYGTTPGGWLTSVTSWGSIYQEKHESTIKSSNDTVASNQPLSNVLASNTMERRESIRLTAPFLLLDAAVPSMPTYGSVIPTIGPYFNPTPTPSGSTSNGYTAVSGEVFPLPTGVETTNPCRDRHWIRGDDGFIYEIFVTTTGTGPSLTTKKLFTQSGSEQPTGNQEFLIQAGIIPCPNWGAFAITRQWGTDTIGFFGFPTRPTGGFYNGATFSLGDSMQPLAVNNISTSTGTAVGTYIGAAGSAYLDLTAVTHAMITANDFWQVEVYQDGTQRLYQSLLLDGPPSYHLTPGFSFAAGIGAGSHIEVRLFDQINGFNFPSLSAAGTFYCV